MAWIDDYLTGVEEVDLQHRELFEVTRRYRETLDESDEIVKEEIQKILKFLVNYTMYHFETEEEFLKQINYSGLEAHKKLHRELIDKLEKILEREMADENRDPNFIYIFLISWLKKHIAGADQAYINPVKKFRKIHDYSAEQIVVLINKGLSKVKFMEDNNLISSEERQKKIVIYLKAFYKGCETSKDEDIENLIKSVNILKSNKTINNIDADLLNEFINELS